MRHAKKVLVVEPVIERRVQLLKDLTGLFTILTAANVEEAIELDPDCDVAIGFIHLGAAQNHAVAQYAYLHAVYGGLCPIVVASDNNGAGFEREIRRIGVSYFAPEPCGREEILCAIKSLAHASSPGNRGGSVGKFEEYLQESITHTLQRGLE